MQRSVITGLLSLIAAFFVTEAYSAQRDYFIAQDISSYHYRSAETACNRVFRHYQASLPSGSVDAGPDPAHRDPEFNDVQCLYEKPSVDHPLLLPKRARWYQCPEGEVTTDYGCEPAPPLDCPSDASPVSHEFELDTTNPNFQAPVVIDVNGCGFVVSSGDTGKDCYVYDGQPDKVFCTFQYSPLGEPAATGSPTGVAPGGGVAYHDTTEPNQSEKTATPEVVQNDVPGPGDVTKTKTETEVTTEGKGTVVTTSEESIVITTTDGTAIQKTTTTITTTKADGTVITETIVSYQKAPVTTTVTAVPKSGGPVTQTTTTIPARDGTTTTTITQSPDGTVTETVTNTGGNGDGAQGAEEQAAEDETEEPVFSGPSVTDAQDFGTSVNAFWSSVSNGPWGSAFNVGGNLQVGTCPPLAFSTPWGEVSTTVHCDIWADIAPVLSSIMLAVWGLLALVILFSA